MKKHTFALLVTLSILLTITTNLFAMGGPTQDGSAETPYLIQDFNDFQTFRTDPNYWASEVHVRLDCNIDLDPNLAGRMIYIQAPIAGDTDTDIAFEGTAYTGSFDGNDHVISNLTVDGAYYCGLFGKADYGSSITDLSLENASVTGTGYYVAALVGYNDSGSITSSYSSGQVTGDRHVGGLVGWNVDGIISESFATGAVNGLGSRVGGLVGWNSGIISESYSTAAVTGDSHVGGLVGYNYHHSSISNSYSTGSVTGDNVVGGLVGYNDSGSITSSYSSAEVTGDYYVGGLVGLNDSGSISESFATAEVNGSSWVGGLVGRNYSGSITSSYSTGAVNGDNDVGGLVGDNNYGSISKSFATGDVNGLGSLVGGLVGYNDSGSISESFATGAVNGDDSRVGGLVGLNVDGSITSSYSTGAVNGDHGVGGLVGWNYGSITSSYSTGAVTGNIIDVGGLVGYNGGSITGSFWDTQTSTMTIGIGDGTTTGATGKTTAEMKTASTFLDAGWDLVNVWNIEEAQTYPLLRKYSAFDTNYDNKINFIDFAIFANNWLDGVEPEPEPEVDNDPPMPNPSQWLTMPYENSGYHIMSAVTASDAATGGNDPVWYKFYVVSGFGMDSQWQLSNEYIYLHSGNTAYQVITCDSIPGTGLPNPANSTAPSEPAATF